MDTIELITRYFPDLDAHRIEQFAAMRDVYADWNSRINVISRRDMDSFYCHHVLHSLAIAKVCHFADGTRVLDVGCGGGFPSVPLAVMFPAVQFTAVDSIGKKIRVVEGVCKALDIKNLSPVNARVESVQCQADYVVSRAVTVMPTIVDWVWKKIRKGGCGSLPNGIIGLKGGDLAAELAATGLKWQRTPISQLFDEEFFSTKEVVYTAR